MESHKGISMQILGSLLSISVPAKTVAIIAFTITAVAHVFVLHNQISPLFGNVLGKCAPVLCLMWFVYLHISPKKFGRIYCAERLFFGLLFSCIGDSFLAMNDMFIQGMASFAVAHLFYISALGWNELNIKYGIAVYTLCAIVTPYLLPPTDLRLRCCIPVYSLLLSTMGWRSLAMLHHKGSTCWNRVVVGTGGVLWMTSDALLAYNEFIQPFQSANIVVMTTYYLGQLGIASSVMLEQQAVMSTIPTN